jgi:hypothetical protein
LFPVRGQGAYLLAEASTIDESVQTTYYQYSERYCDNVELADSKTADVVPKHKAVDCKRSVIRTKYQDDYGLYD